MGRYPYITKKMKLKKKEAIEVVSTFLELVIQGKSIEDISDEMGYDISELSLLHGRLLEMKTLELQSKPVEHVYVEYMIEQLKNVHTLNDLIEAFDGNSRNLAAVVGAVRLRSDIHDRIMEKGQACGVIRKVPEQRESLHGLIIADLTADDLRETIVRQYRKLAKYTTGKTETMAQMRVPKNLHYGPSIEIPEDKESEEEVNPKRKAVLKKKKKKKKKRKGNQDEM